MENENTFNQLKSIILERARKANACREQYGRAYAAETMEQLMEVIRDNFYWCCEYKVIDADLIAEYEKPFSDGRIWANTDVTDGYLIASGTSTVIASGTSTVIASDTSTVRAYGTSTVRAHNTSKVEAYDTSTVIAYDTSTVRAHNTSKVRAHNTSKVEAYDTSTVEAYDTSTVIAYDTSTVRAHNTSKVEAYDTSTVIAYDTSTVRASGKVYILSYSSIDCQLSESAICRIGSQNKILYADDSMTFEKIN
ncbi:MAG: hypothetical protein NC115_11995 [Bacteroidales bacterium]|nr:hypothetical protein [Bacteroidales bacterium]